MAAYTTQGREQHPIRTIELQGGGQDAGRGLRVRPASTAPVPIGFASRTRGIASITQGALRPAPRS